LIADSTQTVPTLRLSSILSGLSYALDLTEGHPRGHASRSCLIGMRIGRALGLTARETVRLRRAALLHDIGKLSVPNRRTRSSRSCAGSAELDCGPTRSTQPSTY